MNFWTEAKINRLDELLKLRPAWSAKQIADDLGCSRNAVIGRCHRCSLELGIPGGFTPTKKAFVKEKIRELAAKNLPQLVIAREIGVSDKVVSYHRRKMGLVVPNWWKTEGYGKKSAEIIEFQPGAWKPAWTDPKKARPKQTREKQWAAQNNETRGQYLARLRAQTRRRLRGLARGGSIEELQAIAAKSDVPVTKCPPGAHNGWLPSYLK